MADRETRNAAPPLRFEQPTCWTGSLAVSFREGFFAMHTPQRTSKIKAGPK
jgi:hypothetical protein